MKKTFYSGALVVGVVINSVGLLFASVTDITQLPLGDQKISTGPKSGYVYSCPTPTGRGGAQTAGTWIHGSTWNLNEKIHVQGSVNWPNATFTISSSTGAGRVITGNGLPVDSPTGVYPIAATDPAYQVDRNPNSITTQSVSYTLPTNPVVAQNPSCVPMGVIGIALNGTAIFNAFDAENRDAVANEVQDSCGGHPQKEGMYHYHGPSKCLPGYDENNTLVGYALDGFGIYSNHDAQGQEISTKDLDECHGKTSEVLWDGKKVNMYHYVLTQDFPYNIGCFKGTPVTSGKTSPASVSATASNSQSSLVITGTANLTLGSTGEDVKKLQTTLEQKGYLVMPKGLAKGYFGKATKTALMKYQKENGITPTGVFGPKTRALHNTTQGMKNKNVTSNQVPKSGAQMKPSGMMLVKDAQHGDTTSQNTPVDQGVASGGMNQSQDMPTPPADAISACDTQDEGGVCTFIAPGNRTISGTCREISENLACVPAR